MAAVWLALPRPDLYGGVSFGTLVTDRHGEPLRLLPAADGRYRLFTPIGEIAPIVQRSTILYEDRRFGSHVGVDPISLARAAWTTYVRRSRVVGASTITMQLARMRFGLDTRAPLGKLVQIFRALQIERHYSKDAILEAYLNLAPYGGNVEGIGAAAYIYLDKTARDLGLAEASALSVVPQHPAARSPGTSRGRAGLFAARGRLLHAARLAGWDTEEVERAAVRPAFRSRSELPFRAPHFVRDHVRPEGLRQRTTLDLGLQTRLERRLREHIDIRHRDGLRNAAAMLVDHRTMEVLAAVGSARFFDRATHGQVNGMRARRSPGSTLKPLLYALALDEGLIHPMTLLSDAPRRFAAYAPENFDRGFLGPVFARDALVYSRNVPAVQLLSSVGVARFRDWLEDAGVGDLRTPQEYGLALGLGGGEITMEELVLLYAMLANGGVWRDLVTDFHRDLPISPRASTRHRVSAGYEPSRRLLSAEASFLVLDMLRDVPRPDARPVLQQRRSTIAWKTGTSFGFRDAWSVGVVGNHVLAVWIGNFDGSANPAFVGRTAAGPLFFALADGLASCQGSSPGAGCDTGFRSLDHADGDDLAEAGLNLRRIDICATTGELAGGHCPRTTRTWFIPGVSPIKAPSVYRAVAVDTETGLRSCRAGTATRLEVYEFWPSDLDAAFRRRGIAIRRPPPWSPECSLDTASSWGEAPVIRSPQSKLTYYAPRPGGDPNTMVLTARADADARTLFWFVDDEPVARVDTAQPAYWAPRPGRHRISVVDDLGRGAAVDVTVRTSPTG